MKFIICWEITGSKEIEAKDEKEANKKFDMISLDKLLEDMGTNPLNVCEVYEDEVE